MLNRLQSAFRARHRLLRPGVVGVRNGIAFLFFIMLVSGCATAYNPATGKQEYVIIDTVQEISIGRNMAAQIEKKYRPDPDGFAQTRIRAIGGALAKVSDRIDIPYEFKVIESKDVNAFTTPGGYIYVFRGIVDTADSDAELASVIAHEIGHVAARHAAKAMEANLGYNIMMSIAFSRSPNPELQRYIDIGYQLLERGYSREDELFADKLSIRYLIRAGFNPYGMISFMQKMERIEREKGAPPLYILSSHPYMSQRIAEAKKEIAMQEALWKTSPR